MIRYGLTLCFVLTAAVSFAQENNCLDCHLEEAVAMQDDVHAQARLSCVDCHGGDPTVDTWICADFDHINNSYGPQLPLPPVFWARVSDEDIGVLIGNFRSALTGDCNVP